MDLLTKIGRNADKRLASQAESWDKMTELWKKGGTAMEAAGLGPRDRRCAAPFWRTRPLLLMTFGLDMLYASLVLNCLSWRLG